MPIKVQVRITFNADCRARGNLVVQEKSNGAVIPVGIADNQRAGNGYGGENEPIVEAQCATGDARRASVSIGAVAGQCHGAVRATLPKPAWTADETLNREVGAGGEIEHNVVGGNQ